MNRLDKLKQHARRARNPLQRWTTPLYDAPLLQRVAELELEEFSLVGDD